MLLFALMLTRRRSSHGCGTTRTRPLAAIAALAVLGVLGVVFLGQEKAGQPLDGPSIKDVGSELFTQWAIPFEIASLVLLVGPHRGHHHRPRTERQE